MPQVDFITYYPIFYIVFTFIFFILFYLIKNNFFNFIIKHKCINRLYTEQVLNIILYNNIYKSSNYIFEQN